MEDQSISSFRDLPGMFGDIVTVLSSFRFRKAAAGYNRTCFSAGPAVSDLCARRVSGCQ